MPSYLLSMQQLFAIAAKWAPETVQAPKLHLLDRDDNHIFCNQVMRILRAEPDFVSGELEQWELIIEVSGNGLTFQDHCLLDRKYLTCCGELGIKLQQEVKVSQIIGFFIRIMCNSPKIRKRSTIGTLPTPVNLCDNRLHLEKL